MDIPGCQVGPGTHAEVLMQDTQRVDLSSVVQAAVATARPLAEAKGICLQMVIDPLDGVLVSADVNRI
jgi:signal transduction histidine kinase